MPTVLIFKSKNLSPNFKRRPFKMAKDIVEYISEGGQVKNA